MSLVFSNISVSSQALLSSTSIIVLTSEIFLYFFFCIFSLEEFPCETFISDDTHHSKFSNHKFPLKLDVHSMLSYVRSASGFSALNAVYIFTLPIRLLLNIMKVQKIRKKDSTPVSNRNFLQSFTSY